MPFLLHIQNSLDGAADHFAAGQVQSFDREVVRVGSAPDADVRLGAGELLPTHFVLVSDATRGKVCVRPAPGVSVFVNQARLDGERELASGDEVRAGHWTFRFQRLYRRAALARRAGLMALVAQALVASILALEAGVVFWLPRQARAAAFWEKEILQQRTTWQLDHLRSINRPGVEEAELERAARLTVARELDALAVYLRQYEDSLTREEWARILTDLQGYGLVLDRLGRRQAFQPLPALDVEAGVLAVLSAHDAKPERK